MKTVTKSLDTQMREVDESIERRQQEIKKLEQEKKQVVNQQFGKVQAFKIGLVLFSSIFLLAFAIWFCVNAWVFKPEEIIDPPPIPPRDRVNNT